MVLCHSCWTTAWPCHRTYRWRSTGPVCRLALDLLGHHYSGKTDLVQFVSTTNTFQSAISTTASFTFLEETYEPVLLERRVAHLRTQISNPNLHHRHSNTLTKSQVLTRAIRRPLALLFTSPVVLLTSIYVGLVYGYIYLLFTSFTPLFTTTYNFTETTTGLTYLGLGIGFAIGLLILGKTSDRIVSHFSPAGEWKAEYRLLPLLPGSLLVPVGLLWYGWSAQAHVHWTMPIIGTGWVGLGTLAVFMPVQSYLIDAFPLWAASAAAANTILRSLAGAFVPLAGPALYRALGQGWGNSLLAFMALAFTPLSWICFRFGGRIREMWPGRVK